MPRIFPGVFNMVNGEGRRVGELLATHPRVDMVSFTGSTPVLTKSARLGAKKLNGELNGGNRLVSFSTTPPETDCDDGDERHRQHG